MKIDLIEITEKALEREFSDQPIIQIVNIIFSDALAQRASDIHFEIEEDTSEVRYRIDGELQRILSLPNSIHASLISRIKVLSHLDISKTRISQDGKFRIKSEMELWSQERS